MKGPIYWIEGPWPGRLAIIPRPRGGDWLAEEVAAWKSEGVHTVVSTLMNDEIADFDLRQQAALCERQGLEFVAFPIPDRSVPSSMSSAINMLRAVEKKLNEAKTAVIHCRQGIGRSAVLAAGLLVLAGVAVQAAIQRVASARGCPVPETQEQRDWLRRFAGELLATTKP